MFTNRFKFAILLAPLIPVLYFSVLAHIFNDSKIAFITLLVSSLFSYGGFFLMGLPLIFLLKNNHWLSTVNLALGSMVLGIFVVYIFDWGFSIVLGSSNKGLFDWLQAAWGIGLAISVAIPFGLIAGFPFFLPNK